MTDDDETIEADGAELAEIRRLVQEARSAGSWQDAAGTVHTADQPSSSAIPAVGMPIEDDGVTVVAEGAGLDELRRMAASLRAAEVDDHTVEVDAETVIEARHAVTEAHDDEATEAADARAGGDEPTSPSSLPQPVAAEAPPQAPVALPSTPLPVIDHVQEPERSVRPAPAAMPVVAPLDEYTAVRSSSSDPGTPLAAGTNGSSASSGRVASGRWQPPERMIMPSDPERRVDEGPGPWRFVAAALALILVLLLALIGFGVLGGSDSAPPDGEVPAEGEAPADGGAPVDGEAPAEGEAPVDSGEAPSEEAPADQDGATQSGGGEEGEGG